MREHRNARGWGGVRHSVARYGLRERRSWVLGMALLLPALVGLQRVPGADAEYWTVKKPVGTELQRLVPTQHFAVLGEGRARRTKWGIYTYRGPGKSGAERPCIEEVTLNVFGVSSSATECGALSPADKLPTFVLLGTSITKHGRTVGESVLGATFESNVAKVELKVRPGAPVVRKTTMLSAYKARKARVAPFNYLATGFGRDLCIEQFKGFGAEGAEVYASPSSRCSRHR